MEIDYNTFIEYLKKWFVDRYDKFQYYWPLHGGWEGFVQVDFAAWLAQNHPLVTLHRESKIFKKNQRLDWLINADSSVPYKKIAVEVKCLSGKTVVAEKPDIIIPRFGMGIKNDIKKLNQKNINIQHRNCQTVAIAIISCREAIKAMNDCGLKYIGTGGDGEVQIWGKKLYGLVNDDWLTTTVSKDSSFSVDSSIPNANNNPTSEALRSLVPSSFGSDDMDLNSGTPGSNFLGSSQTAFSGNNTGSSLVSSTDDDSNDESNSTGSEGTNKRRRLDSLRPNPTPTTHFGYDTFGTPINE